MWYTLSGSVHPMAYEKVVLQADTFLGGRTRCLSTRRTASVVFNSCGSLNSHCLSNTPLRYELEKERGKCELPRRLSWRMNTSAS